MNNSEITHYPEELAYRLPGERLILVFIGYVLIASSLERLGLVNRYMSIIPEIFGTAVLIVILLNLKRHGRPSLSPVYWLVFGLFVIHLVGGAIVNDANIGGFAAGLRYYLRWTPVFFLPVLVGTRPIALSKQLQFIGVIAAIQVPVSFFQRFVIGYGLASGDVVRGTLPNSASLSIFLVVIISFAAAAFVKNRWDLQKVVLFSSFLAIPMTLNESKGALILLPIAVASVALAVGSGPVRVRRLMWAFIAMVSFVAVYIPIYDSYMGERQVYSVIEFFTEGHIVTYLAPNTAAGIEHRIGRLDAVLAAWIRISEDPLTLMFGLGVGAVSDSFLGPFFYGEYYDLFNKYVYGTVSRLLWELGLGGVLGVLLLLGCIFRDALLLKDNDGVEGVLGVAWVATVVIMVPSMFYSSLIEKEAIAFPFWYFSGVVASYAQYRRRERHSPNQVRQGHPQSASPEGVGAP